MTYHNFAEDIYRVINNAHKSIILMFKQKKVKEIEFQVPLTFVIYLSYGPELMKFRKIIFNDNETIHLVDETGFAHPLYKLVDSIDLCKVYDCVYKYFHENVNVKKAVEG